MESLTSEAGIVAESQVTSRKISNSEVSTWLTCQMRYFFEFDLAIQPLHYTETLSRGILGHEVLAVYYKALQGGHSHSDAVDTARSHLMRYMGAGNTYDLPVVLDVDRILSGYWPIAADLPWRVLHVEEQFDAWLTNEFQFSMRLDLLIQDMSDGKIKVVDHKFVYDFWSGDDLRLNPQLPKYIGTLRANNVKVDEAILNQLRYRKIKEPRIDQLFQQTPYTPPNARIVNTMRQQIIASQKIVEWRELPIELREKRALRVLNKQVCRSCPVKNLCMESLDGNSIDYLLAGEYKKRDYGYNEPSTAMLESLV